MNTHPREILIYYNSTSSSDRKTIAHAQCTGFKIRSYCHNQSPSTATSWRDILIKLDRHPKEILNKAHPYYQSNIRGKEFDAEGWLNVIKHNPDMIKAPIAINGKKAMLVETPTDIYKF